MLNYYVSIVKYCTYLIKIFDKAKYTVKVIQVKTSKQLSDFSNIYTWLKSLENYKLKCCMDTR